MVLLPKLAIAPLRTLHPRSPIHLCQCFTLLIRHSHVRINSPVKPPLSEPPIELKNVAIFWDLASKPPKPTPTHEAALKLRQTASSFGLVRYMVAYASHRSLTPLREQRKSKDSEEKHHCGVCGRNFYNYEKLVNHFRVIHERENAKRRNQIESACGSRRVRLVAKYSVKMEKFKRALRDFRTPKTRNSLGDEAGRSGFWVRSGCNRTEEMREAMRSHIVDLVEKGRIGCLVVASDDPGLVTVLREAKARRVNTVIVGNEGDGVLKRAGDSGFLWREVVMGKAKKEAVSVLGKWKDRHVLQRLEWTYDPEIETNDDGDDDDDHGSCFEGNDEDDDDDDDRSKSWWEIESSLGSGFNSDNNEI